MKKLSTHVRSRNLCFYFLFPLFIDQHSSLIVLEQKKTLVFKPKKKENLLGETQEYFEEQTNTLCLKTDTLATDINSRRILLTKSPHSCFLRPLVYLFFIRNVGSTKQLSSF